MLNESKDRAQRQTPKEAGVEDAGNQKNVRNAQHEHQGQKSTQLNFFEPDSRFEADCWSSDDPNVNRRQFTVPKRKIIGRTFTTTVSNTADFRSGSNHSLTGGSHKNFSRGSNTDLSNRYLTSNTAKKSHQQPEQLTPLHQIEDMRISKILRRLCAETGTSTTKDLCDKLEMVVLESTNAAYIRRSFDFVAESLISVLLHASSECSNQIAEIFGMVGYVMRTDFNIYINWIFKTYESNKLLRTYMMQALKVTLVHDKWKLEITPHSDRLISGLKDLLEAADVTGTFIAVSEAISQFSQNYKRSFEKHFTDVVDILVGWHLETEQSTSLKEHCSKILQEFSKFFVKKSDFTLGLLGQFLEDLSTFGDDVESGRRSPNTAAPEISIGSFIGAFNSVLKCLADGNTIIAFETDEKLLSQAMRVISRVGYNSLKASMNSETVRSINEFYILMMSNKTECCSEMSTMQSILQIVELEMASLDKFNNIQINSFLFVLITLVRKMKANIPLQFIASMLAPTNTQFYKLRYTKDGKHFKCLVKLFQEILLIKNVPLLQEAYKHIRCDVRSAIQKISDQNSTTYDLSRAECTLNFNLLAISVLATQTSSIIGLYALQPSILELLINDLAACNAKIWSNHPTSHSAIIELLSVHCVKNNHYTVSSSLLAAQFFSKMALAETSPSSENFGNILRFLSNITKNKELDAYVTLQILDWINFLLPLCQKHAEILMNYQDFIQIVLNTCAISETATDEVSMECGKALKILLLSYETVNAEILLRISETCLLHLTSTSDNIRILYGKVFAKLPLSVSLKQFSNRSGAAKLKAIEFNDLQHWYAACSMPHELREKCFKEFVEKLSPKADGEYVLKYLHNIFRKCCVLYRGHSERYISFALKDLTCLTAWAQWESAQYCVRNKLRTALGKPQDTFLFIEAIIKQSARKLASCEETEMVRNADSLIANAKNAKILLGFSECLEKAIFNAAEGSAFSIPSPEKPSRVFFRVNMPTCLEWFNRIRNAVDLIAQHSMEPEVSIRYSEAALKSLVKNNKTDSIIFELTVLSYVRGLLRRRESDALCGVYVWSKNVSGKQFLWIKIAAEQAAGHYEKAAESYMQILQTKCEIVEKQTLQFISEQILECFYYANQWKDMLNFIDAENINSNNLFFDTSLEKIKFYAADSSSETELMELATWETFDAPESVKRNFSLQKMISLAENTMEMFIIKPKLYDGAKLDLCSKILRTGLEECLRSDSKNHANHLIILNHISDILQRQNVPEKCSTDVGLESLSIDKSFGSFSLTQTLKWADYLNSKLLPSANRIVNTLRLRTVTLARKEGNFRLCQKELEKFFDCIDKEKNFGEILNLKSDVCLDDVAKKMLSCSANAILWSPDVINGIYETSKIFFSVSEHKDTALILASTCCIAAGISESEIVNRKTARIYLKISDWLPQTSETLLTDENSAVFRLLKTLPDVREYPDDDNINSIMKLTDVGVGKLIKASVNQCSTLAKAWVALGNWCYRWGRKVVEVKKDPERAGLRSTDIQAIKDLLNTSVEDDVEKIVNVLNQHHASIDDEEIEPNEISSTELIERQLRSIPILSNVSSQIVSSIIEIWRQAHKSVYRYYEMAAEGYFKYLNLAVPDCSLSSSDADEAADCSIVTATLRLLRLVVKHALGLQEVLESGLSNTPTRPWKVIIPQLFSRLNHHEPYVRKRVSELLCRVANDSPHLIIFPAVVGAAQEQNICNILNISMPRDENSEDTNNILAACFNSLLDTLLKHDPETVEQVQLLVRELKRVTLLWDEFWLHALTQLYVEYAGIFNAFEAESSYGYLPILEEKHRILTSYLVEDMEQLYAKTSRPAETNNERNFQEKYSKLIQATIEDLKKPLNVEKPNESWHKIKQLYTIFQQKLQKSSQTTLKMIDISPVLANMKNTAISMPGVETYGKDRVYIQAVDNTVYILLSKTKPKKLAFFGSDGKRYTYLFKGLEDLHLDERIMQFLSIANSMMSRSQVWNGNPITYRAHHYSVIPLGPRSGLISWVDNCNPIFGLYKKWQQREAASPRKGKQFVAMRPSELFHHKLDQLLAENNIEITENRKIWPISALRTVLEELSNETPNDLISKEIWYYSTNAATYRQATRTYSLSVAVMSVIGYVIGLGDRHLDNILLILTTGEIVHIDYNVCFEKGKTLRVPEKVPFRMTPNIQEALGVTGIEGTFRLACEHVLKTLRKERETLLTLLEAFVYDPLVDWAVNDDGTTTSTRTTSALAAAADLASVRSLVGITRNASESGISDATTIATDRRKITARNKKLENEVMRDSLSSRFTEIKPELTHYRDEVNEQLVLMAGYLDELERQRCEMLGDESERDLLSKQLAMVREVETLGSAMSSHALNTLSNRFSVFRKAEFDFDNAKQDLLRKHKQYETGLHSYVSTISELTNDGCKQLILQIEEVSSLQAENEFEIVRDLLENSAQGALFFQADQARKELEASFIQQLVLIRMASDTLSQYEKVARFLPGEKIDQHRFHKYATWCSDMLGNPDDSVTVLREFKNMLDEEKLAATENADKIQCFAKELDQQRLEANAELNKKCAVSQEQMLGRIQESSHEATQALSILLQLENGAVPAIQCAILSYMCELNSHYIALDEFREESLDKGNNFDDSIDNLRPEQMTYLTVITEFAKIIATKLEEDVNGIFNSYIESFKEIVSLFHLLKQLRLEFQANILPRAVQLFMMSSSSSIDELNSKKFYEIIDVIKEELGEFYERGTRTQNLRYQTYLNEMDGNVGVLFQWFSNTFKEMSSRIEKCLQSVAKISRQADKNSLDQVQAAGRNVLPKLSDSYITDLLTELEIKHLECMAITFARTESMVMSMRTNLFEDNVNLKSLQQPLAVYSNFCEWKALLGLGPLVAAYFQVAVLEHLKVPFSEGEVISTESLINNLIDNSFSNNKFSLTAYRAARKFCDNIYLCAEQSTIFESLAESIPSLQKYLHFCQTLCSVHAWLHERAFSRNVQPAHITHKKIIVSTLQNVINNLNNWQISINKISDELTSYTTAILQRLKWAVGANPSLLSIQQAFDECIVRQCDKLKKNTHLAHITARHCTAVFNFENLNINIKDFTEEDERLVIIISGYSKKFSTLQAVASGISRVELALVQLLDPEGSIDHIWLENVSGLLDEMTHVVQQKIALLEKELTATQDNLQMCAHRLRSLMGSELRTEVRFLLILILKIDGTSQTLRSEQFQNKYKQFLSRIDDLHVKILSKDFTKDIVKQIRELIRIILVELEVVYSELLKLLCDKEADEKEMMQSRRNSGTPIRESRKGIQTKQKRNAYAVSVWRRIRMKLEGRDPDPNRRLTASEQVDWMIREAMHPDNLAVLYEGWTPWV